MPVIGDDVGLNLERIMLATGFSASSAGATRYAKALAKRFSARLMITHVIDVTVAAQPEAIIGRPVDWMRQAAGENSVRLVEELTAAGIHSSSHTMEDSNPAAAIVRLANRLNAQLIVTGTNARQGLNRPFVGSCAEGIIRHADCPVLSLGPKAKLPPDAAGAFHSIIFATDFNANAMEEAALACAFARDSRASLYFCHVTDDTDAKQDLLALQATAAARLKALIPNASYDWVDAECVVEHGSPADAVLALAKNVGADLIVMGARRSTFLSRHLIDGTVGRVLANAECPVMTIRERAVPQID